MKIGSYQFAVSGDVEKNFETMKKAACLAAENGVNLLIFPECAMTGYPPLKTASPRDIDFDTLERYSKMLQRISKEKNICLLVGSVTKAKGRYYNSAVLFSPDLKSFEPYHKRALWGWDKEHFSEGKVGGIYEICGYRFGVRICYEIRFPEYFRELFRAKTDINIVLFCDVSEHDDLDRYELIKAHLRTRAVENACVIVSVNDISPFQTAPSAVIDWDGNVRAELPRNTEGLMVYEFERKERSLGAIGRAEISNQLIADKR